MTAVLSLIREHPNAQRLIQIHAHRLLLLDNDPKTGHCFHRVIVSVHTQYRLPGTPLCVKRRTYFGLSPWCRLIHCILLDTYFELCRARSDSGSIKPFSSWVMAETGLQLEAVRSFYLHLFSFSLENALSYT